MEFASRGGDGGLGGRDVFTFTTTGAGGADVIHILTMPTMPPELSPKPRTPLVQTLGVPLEVLYTGGMMSCCVKSQAKNSFGPLEPLRVKYFEVEILPGYKHGTRIKFDKCFPEDALYLGEPKVDVTFVIEQEKHKVFKRRNEHIFINIYLSKEQLAAQSFEVDVKFLNGETERITGTRGSCHHGATRLFKGKGMPARRGGRATGGYGDVTVRFVWPLSVRADLKQCCTVS